jgi:hypothetical protein
MFRVTTLPIDKPKELRVDDEESSSTDFKNDFFHKPVHLTVSGQV